MSADLPDLPVPPCACCGETNDLHPVVYLRDGFRVTGPSASYHGQIECWVCGGRGPRGTGPTPDAAAARAPRPTTRDDKGRPHVVLAEGGAAPARYPRQCGRCFARIDVPGPCPVCKDSPFGRR